MVEMHDMVVEILHPQNKVADVGGVFRDFHLDGVFERAGGGQRVSIGAHAAGTLREVLHVTGIAAHQNLFKAAEEGTATARFRDPAPAHFHFNAQMAFNTGEGIDDNGTAIGALGRFSDFAHGCIL